MSAGGGHAASPAVNAVLFLGKADDAHTALALEYCRANLPRVSAWLGKWGDPLPAAAAQWSGDLIISYLSRWIVPGDLLARTRLALNFHPGPPEYPGYGCNNFAIYDGVADYGVTCHHMVRRVDTGPIVAVHRFPVLAADNAGTLLKRAYDVQLALFREVVGRIIRGEALPASGESWTRKPYTREQFAALARLTPDLSAEELARRRRALDVGALKPRP